jgi:hypothetical protein
MKFANTAMAQEIEASFQDNLQRITTTSIKESVESYVFSLGGFKKPAGGYFVPCETGKEQETVDKIDKLLEALQALNRKTTWHRWVITRGTVNSDEAGRQAELTISKDLIDSVEMLTEHLKKDKEKLAEGKKVRRAESSMQKYVDITEHANMEVLRLEDILKEHAGSFARIKDTVNELNTMMLEIRSNWP